MLGLAVITYNRLPRLRRTLANIRKHTGGSYKLIVADDGSTDGTAPWCRQENYQVITGQNRGVSWNKNRALFALAAMKCDPILLIEDDCYPAEDNWQSDWLDATALWHHVSFATRRIRKRGVTGSGTPQSPFLSAHATAQCSSISLEALSRVGFLDSRFTGCGIEHKEWTSRIISAGYAKQKVISEGGRPLAAKIYIAGGLSAEEPKSYRTVEDVARNRSINRQLKNEPIFRLPWGSSNEKELFIDEQLASGQKLLPDFIGV